MSGNRVIATTGLAACLLLLAACGREPPAGEDSAEAAPEEVAETLARAPLPPTKEVEVVVEGAVERREAVLERSPQGYAIYVLPQIEFTPEEPGRDIVFARVDDRFFVRIERLDPAAPLLQMRQDAELELSALGPVEAVSAVEIDDPFFRSADIFLRASSAELTKLIVVLPIENVRYRFTLHLPHAEAAEGINPSLWAMLRTIRSIQP